MSSRTKLLLDTPGHHAALSTARSLGRVAFLAGNVGRFPGFDAYAVRRNHNPCGTFDRQKPSGQIMADAKLAARQEVNSGSVGDYIQRSEQGQGSRS
jgi:hypothetical protein